MGQAQQVTHCGNKYYNIFCQHVGHVHIWFKLAIRCMDERHHRQQCEQAQKRQFHNNLYFMGHIDMSLDKRISRQKQKAFHDPCLHADQCAKQKFQFMAFGTSAVLTCNVGLEWNQFFQGRTLWHVSIGLGQLGFNETKAHNIALKILGNVGIKGKEFVEVGDFAYHLRRCMTSQEEGRLRQMHNVKFPIDMSA